MMKCPNCQFENEEGALFCEQCKSDLGVAGQPAQATGSPHAAVSEISSPMAAVAFAEAGVKQAMPVAQVDAGVAVASQVPIAIAVPLPETPPFTVASDVPLAAVALAEVGPLSAAPPRPRLEGTEAAPVTAPDISLPSGIAAPETPPPAVAEPVRRLPPEAKPKLVVLRGQRVNAEYPLYEGDNYIGRADDQAVDIDLEDQEPPDRIWSSRQHALIAYEDGLLTIEDLNSTNGTFVNRMRLYPGQKRTLLVNDIIQVGNVQLKVMV